MQTRAVRVGDIAGELHQPKATKQLIIICHGYKDSQTNPTIVAVTNLLNKKGHATFTFNFSPGSSEIDIQSQVNDILSLTDYFTQFDEFIMLAGSFAAVDAAIAAMYSDRITGVITINGFFGTSALCPELRSVFRKARYASFVHPTYRRIFRYLKRELKPERMTQPVLLIHSKVDEQVFIGQSEWFFARLKTAKQFITFETSDHNVTSPKDREAAAEAVHEWLKTI